MASDPYIRIVDTVTDLDGNTAIVGVDYDTVTINHIGDEPIRLDQAQAELFARAYVSACWQAGQNARSMAGEVPGAL